MAAWRNSLFDWHVLQVAHNDLAWPFWPGGAPTLSSLAPWWPAKLPTQHFPRCKYNFREIQQSLPSTERRDPNHSLLWLLDLPSIPPTIFLDTLHSWRARRLARSLLPCALSPRSFNPSGQSIESSISEAANPSYQVLNGAISCRPSHSCAAW